MRNVNFGRLGQAVSVVGQGTWYLEQADRHAGINALRQGIDLGLTHIDTAEMYGDGAAEDILGEAIQGRRDDVFLVSKVLPWNASYDGTIAACEASLRRLGTDRLDCYLLHWPGQHPLEDTFAAMEKLEQDGKIGSFGVSNFDVADLEDALAVVGEGKLACNQVLYHLEQRAIEHDVLPWCAAHGLSVIAYSPFGHGSFPAPGSRGWEALQRVGARHNVTERQVALGFLARHSNVATIPKAVNPDHVACNAGAGDLRLDEADIRELDAAFPLGRKPSHLPML